MYKYIFILTSNYVYIYIIMFLRPNTASVVLSRECMHIHMDTTTTPLHTHTHTYIHTHTHTGTSLGVVMCQQPNSGTQIERHRGT